MNEEYRVIAEWSYWDGKQNGVCEHNGKKYVYWLHDWSWDGLYPVDDDGHDLPRAYDLYEMTNETFSLFHGWDLDKIDAWVAVREPVRQCSENQLVGNQLSD